MLRGLLVFLTLGFLILSGCNSSVDRSDSGSSGQGSVRVVHAASDAPSVKVLLDDDVMLSRLDYGRTGQRSKEPGQYDVTIEAILPGGETSTAIDTFELSVSADTRYDVVAVGSVADDTLEALVFESGASFSSSSRARLYAAHLAPDAPEVDVYLSAADADPDLGETDPDFSFSYGERSDQLTVDAGDYRIRITVADSTEVVFDSGTLTLAAGNDLMLAAVPNTGVDADASPVSLLVHNNQETTRVFHADQQAGLRIVHASGDTGGLDVFVDDPDTAEIEELALAETAPAQAGRDSYLQRDAGSVEVRISEAGQASGDALIVQELEMVAGQGYTLLALDNNANIDALVLTDSIRSVATQATVRIVHASREAGELDVYLVPPGEDFSDVEVFEDNLPFQQATRYSPVAEGEYRVMATVAFGGTVRIESDPFELDDGGVYTIILRDETDSTGLSNELILLDDFTD